MSRVSFRSTAEDPKDEECKCAPSNARPLLAGVVCDWDVIAAAVVNDASHSHDQYRSALPPHRLPTFYTW